MSEFRSWSGLTEKEITGPIIAAAQEGLWAFSNLMREGDMCSLMLLANGTRHDVERLVRSLNITMWRGLVNLFPEPFIASAVKSIQQRQGMRLLPQTYRQLVEDAAAFRLGTEVHVEVLPTDARTSQEELSSEGRRAVMLEEAEQLLWRVLDLLDADQVTQARDDRKGLCMRLFAQLQAHERLWCRPIPEELTEALRERQPILFKDGPRSIMEHQRTAYMDALEQFAHIDQQSPFQRVSQFPRVTTA